MPSTVSVILALAAIVAVTWVVVAFRRSREAGGSFWDYVRDPGLMPDVSDINRRIEAEAEAIRDSPAAIAGLVDHFVFKAKSEWDAWDEKKLLTALGDKVYPRALGILRDASLREKLMVATLANKNLLPESPLGRLCALLGSDPPAPPEVVELLALFLETGSDEIRRKTAGVVASTGLESAVPLVAKALHDREEYVRSAALRGTMRALEAGHAGAGAREKLFDAVAARWPADTSFAVCDSLPDVLLCLDRDRAIARLIEPDVLSADFEPVWRLFEAALKHSVLLPRDRLLSIVAEASAEPMEYPKGYILGGALACLGMCRNPEDLPLLEGLLEHGEDTVVEGAANGLRQYHGHKETVRDLYETEAAQGRQGLTLVERHLFAVRMLDAEVRNGGFAQYFFNSSGDLWPDALAGLENAGAVEHAGVLLATLKSFPGATPSTRRDHRQMELAKIASRREIRKQKEGPFHLQDDAWYALPSGLLTRLLFKYDLANPGGRLREPLV